MIIGVDLHVLYTATDLIRLNDNKNHKIIIVIIMIIAFVYCLILW